MEDPSEFAESLTRCLASTKSIHQAALNGYCPRAAVRF